MISLLAVLALAGLTRALGLGSESLSPDEAYSARVAERPASEVLSRVRLQDPHPPLYYLSLNLWTDMAGYSEEALRGPSAAFGAAAVGVVFLVGLELGGLTTALAAGVLAALSFFLIQHSQEARMYSLLLLMSALSYYFFLPMARGRAGLGAAFGYALSTGLLLYTHYHSAFIVLAQVATAALLWRRMGRARAWWLASLSVAAASFIPWLPTFLGHLGLGVERTSWVGVPTLRSLAVVNMLWASSPFYVPAGPYVIRLHLILALFMDLLALVGLLARRGALLPKASTSRAGSGEVLGGLVSEEAAVLGIWAAVPVLVPFVAGLLGSPIFWPRFLIGGLPAYYLLVARGLASIRGRWLFWGSWVVILALNAPGMADYYRLDQKAPWDEVARLVEARASGGDLVVLAPRHKTGPFNYYYRGPLDLLEVSRLSAPADVAAQFKAESAARGRLWLIGHGQSETYRLVRGLIDGRAAEEHDFHKVRAVLYELRPASGPP